MDPYNQSVYTYNIGVGAWGCYMVVEMNLTGAKISGKSSSQTFLIKGDLPRPHLWSWIANTERKETQKIKLSAWLFLVQKWLLACGTQNCFQFAIKILHFKPHEMKLNLTQKLFGNCLDLQQFWKKMNTQQSHDNDCFRNRCFHEEWMPTGTRLSVLDYLYFSDKMMHFFLTSDVGFPENEKICQNVPVFFSE